MSPKPQHIQVIIAPNASNQTGTIVAPYADVLKNFTGRNSMYCNKLRRFLAMSAMAFFLGASLAHAQEVTPPIIIDSDGDGIADDVDECDLSITTLVSPTIVINGVDTGIQNTASNGLGCTLADQIEEMIDVCLDEAKNHGKFVSCVSHETNILKRAKTISGKQKGKIQSIVSKMH